MITRGYYIGEIIDELSSICSQIRFRSKLNLLDFNIYIENFFRDILNIIENKNFVNLNESKSNFPGLDLYDSTDSIGIQVSSTNTIEKIRDTLEKVGSSKDLVVSNCHKIIILIVGYKQKKYNISKLKYIDKYNFTEHDIWDVNTLVKKVIDLPIESLKNLYELIKNEALRVKIELEIPNESGVYPTNLQDYIEKPPQITINRFNSFYDFLGIEEKEDRDDEKFKNLSYTLSHLPRITRQFFAYFLENREKEVSIEKICFIRERLTRLCLWPDLDGEIRLLIKYKLIYHTIEDLNFEYNLDHLRHEVYCVTDNEFIASILDYIEQKKINIQKVITELNFSDFN